MKKTQTEIQNSLRDLGLHVSPNPEFKRAAKSRIMELVQPKPVHYPKFAGAFLGILLLLVFGGGTVLAAQSSLPGSSLYPVKILSEKVAVAVAPKSIKTKVNSSIIERRAVEEKIINKKIDQSKTDAANKNSNTVKQIPNKIVEEDSVKKDEVIESVIKDAPTEVIQAVTPKQGIIQNAGEVIKSNSIKLQTVTK